MLGASSPADHYTADRNPKAYLEAMRHLSVQPHQCAMVAAHIFDLRAAASLGMRTIYVPRPDEDEVIDVKTKAEGGEVDYVVNSFVELAQIIASIEWTPTHCEGLAERAEIVIVYGVTANIAAFQCSRGL